MRCSLQHTFPQPATGGAIQGTARCADLGTLASEDRVGRPSVRGLPGKRAAPCIMLSWQSCVLINLPPLCAQVFFLDSLKFFLSLYGHKLPVLSMDISSDSTLLVSGSADKNIKIWGLDFGDCHKSLFAHQDSVMQVHISCANWCKDVCDLHPSNTDSPIIACARILTLITLCTACSYMGSTYCARTVVGQV